MTTDPAERLAELVGRLAVLRDRGWKEARDIREQRAWREGVSAAMLLMASSALLMTMDAESTGPAGEPVTRQ